MEPLGNKVFVRNVDTGLMMARVREHWRRDPENKTRLGFAYLEALDESGEPLGFGVYRGTAPYLVARYEEDCGYPHFKGFPKALERDRVERLVGTKVADFVCQLLQMVLEGANGGVQFATKKKFYDLLRELLDLWDISHCGSWNAERRRSEPYFADPKPENPRLNFGGALRTYGLIELRKRFPQESDETLKHLLWWPTDMMARALDEIGMDASPYELEELAKAASNALRSRPHRAAA